jgi:hypothetical protein
MHTVWVRIRLGKRSISYANIQEVWPDLNLICMTSVLSRVIRKKVSFLQGAVTGNRIWCYVQCKRQCEYVPWQVGICGRSPFDNKIRRSLRIVSSNRSETGDEFSFRLQYWHGNQPKAIGMRVSHFSQAAQILQTILRRLNQVLHNLRYVGAVS